MSMCGLCKEEAYKERYQNGNDLVAKNRSRPVTAAIRTYLIMLMTVARSFTYLSVIVHMNTPLNISIQMSNKHRHGQY